jgi:L-asparaginase
LNNKLIIINVGGTFNKIYEPLSGKLNIPKSNETIKEIIKKVSKKDETIKVDGILFKDSLEMDDSDRMALVDKINSLDEDKIIIVHGTDTMDKSAQVLSKNIKNKTIVFVGAMQPYALEPVEASATLFMALGFLQNTKKSAKNSVYICMNGLIKKHKKIRKNYKLGVFECH